MTPLISIGDPQIHLSPEAQDSHYVRYLSDAVGGVQIQFSSPRNTVAHDAVALVFTHCEVQGGDGRVDAVVAGAPDLRNLRLNHPAICLNQLI